MISAVVLSKTASFVISLDGKITPFTGSASNFKLYGYANSTTSTFAQDYGYSNFQPIDTWVTVDAIADQAWTGSAVEPTVVVKDKDDATKTLTKDKDYTVSYKNNTNAGTATVTITGIGDYEYATATKDFTIIKYTFTEGTDQTITVGDNKDLTFKVDGPLDLLDKVYINDEELDAANYTTASGSTIITLKKEYVSTLSAGTYTLKATYTNGVSASTEFVIKAKETPTTPTKPSTPTTNNSTTNNSTNVNTGDNSNITLWISLLSLSGLISLGYIVLSKKRKMN